MADMTVTARFAADISDMKSKMDTLTRGMNGLEATSGRTGRGIGSLGKGVAVAGIAFGAATAGVGLLGAGLTALARQGQDSLAVQKTTEQIIKSTGSAAGVTATQVGALADALSKKTGIDDEAIQTGSNLILTFKNVKNAGEGMDAIFNRATGAALDLSKAGFGSVDSASKMLGKALNDPVKGITALSRAGVTFTQQQKDQIKAMAESGDMLGAQKAILAEVESQVGGVAEATKSPLEAIQTMLGNLAEDVGKTLLPMFNQIADSLGPVLESLGPPLSHVVEMLGGALVGALQALTPVFQPLSEALGAVAGLLGEVLATAITALVPVITPLLGMFAELANVLGPVFSAVLSAVMPLVQGLGGVIAALAPAFLALVSALAPVVEILAGTLGSVLQSIVPLIVRLAEVVGGFLTQAVAALSPYWQELANLLGSVLSAVLPPLIDVVMALLDALVPILDPVAELIGLMVSLATPVLQVVAALTPLLTLGVQLIAAVLTPLLKVIGQVIGAMVRWLNSAIKPLMPAFKEGMKVITQFAATAVRAAAQVVRHFGTMVQFLIDNVFGNIVDGAASAFGWIPVVGDGIKSAQANFAEFASSTVSNIEGVAANLDGVATQLDTMAQGYTVPVTVQYSAVYDESMKMSMREGAVTPPPVKPPKPTPYAGPTPSATSGSSADKEAEEREKKRIEQIEKFVQRYNDALDRMKQGRDSLMASVKKSPFAEMLGGLEQSEIESVFGKDGSIGQVISSYDQLGAAVNDFYKPLMNVELFGKKAAKAAKQSLADAKTMLDAAAQTALSLMKQREMNTKALSDLEQTYADGVESINKSYDALDKAANDSLKAVEDKWNNAIPALEAALQEANAAFDKENAVLQKMISARDDFLGRIGDGFRNFLNDMKSGLRAGASAAEIRSSLNDRLQAVRDFTANIRTLMSKGLDPTLVQEFVAQGVSGAGDIVKTLAGASSQDIAEINAAQGSLAQEIASFQQYASAQWFDAGIAQQEAIVGPLAAARDQAQAALDAANASRKAEIDAANAHIQTLKDQRQQALNDAKAQYETQKAALIAQGVEIDAALQANATNLHNGIANLQNTVPPEMFKAGRKSITQILKGFEDKFPEVKKELNDKMDGLAASMNRTATVTVRTVYEAAGSLPARAMGGPVSARTAYLVGERGPEVFVPGSAGNIIPNSDLRMASVPSTMLGGSNGGGTIIVNNSFEVNVQTLVGDRRETGRIVVEAIKSFESSNGAVFASA